MTVLCRVVLAFAAAVWATSAAHAITASELERLLKSVPAHAVTFHELRESPWLAVPIESRGTMHYSPQWLDKRVESPRQETWRLLSDRMEWVGPAGTGTKQILFSQAPALGALANALRRVVTGDLLALERDYLIVLQGDLRAWTVQLQPKKAEVAHHLDHIELQGAGASLQVFIVVERQGERTTTRFGP